MDSVNTEVDLRDLTWRYCTLLPTRTVYSVDMSTAIGVDTLDLF